MLVGYNFFGVFFDVTHDVRRVGSGVGGCGANFLSAGGIPLA